MLNFVSFLCVFSCFFFQVRPFGAPPDADILDVSLHLPFQSNPPKASRDEHPPSQSQTQASGVSNIRIEGEDKGDDGLGDKEASNGGSGRGVGEREQEDPLDNSWVVEVRGQDLPLQGVTTTHPSVDRRTAASGE